MAKFARRKNVAKKNLHQRSWAKNANEKLVRIAEQAMRKKANDAYRERGDRTPYQERKRDSYLSRIARKYGSDVSKAND